MANFHAESTRYLLSRSNCFPQAGMRQQQRRRRRRGGSLGGRGDYHHRCSKPVSRRTGRRKSRRRWGEGERGGMQNYLRYGRGHLCRNETSAVPPNRILGTLSFSHSLSLSLFLSRLVDANSYPLVFPRNLALSLPPGKFLRPRFRYRSHLPDRRFRSH